MNNLSVSVAGAGNSKIGRESYSSSRLVKNAVCWMFVICSLRYSLKRYFFDEVLTLSDYCPDYRILAHGCAAGSLVGNYNSSCTASAICRNNSKSAKYKQYPSSVWTGLLTNKVCTKTTDRIWSLRMKVSVSGKNEVKVVCFLFGEEQERENVK